MKKPKWDIGIIILIGVVMAMMIVPLSPPIIDALVSLSICVSVLIIALSLLIKNPLGLSSFPTILLIVTLYRLALNISSTRLILTQADAGRIIGGFGGFVVAEDVIVGFVIFSIVILVLFLVITKGAQRVAEVAARFTLDALPGMQAALDSDLQNSFLSSAKFTQKREALQNESMFYGSLDGAMKFVRGDAMAALAITGINLVGGILIGMLRREMGFAEALDVYGRLTIGDGLVSMIPALLISTAAGILVTRLSSGNKEGSLGEVIGKQLTDEPLALLTVALVSMLLSFIPGLPLWPFLIISIIFISLFLHRRSCVLAEEKKQKPLQKSFINSKISIDEVQSRLDRLSQTHPMLVKEIGGHATLPKLAEMIAEMEEDGLGEVLLPEIIEAAIREPMGLDMDDWVTRIRNRMGEVICSTLPDKEELKVLMFCRETESMLSQSLTTTSRGKELALPLDLSDDLIKQIQEFKESADVVVTNINLRKPLARFLSSQQIDLMVISRLELNGKIKLTTNTISIL